MLVVILGGWVTLAGGWVTLAEGWVTLEIMMFLNRV